MPPLQTTKERLLQPLWSGWRIDKRNNDTEPLFEHLNLFVADLGNIFKTNMRSAAALVADRSALIRRIGVFASFDCMEDYEEFWNNCSFDLNMGHRTFHSLNMSDIEIPEEHGCLESGAPKPTHKYGYFGWFNLELPLEVPPRRTIYAQLHSSQKMVKAMDELLYAPREDFAGVTIFLDTEMIREVM